MRELPQGAAGLALLRFECWPSLQNDSAHGNEFLGGDSLTSMTRSHTLLITVLFFGLSPFAAGQNGVDIDLGIRGGLLAQPSFQQNYPCIDTACGFALPTSTFDTIVRTVGPTVGVLLFDRFEARFEAVRRRFGYEEQSSLGTSISSSTSGHFWEYPLLATYRLSPGPVRPFAGGGISLGTSGSYTTNSQFTTTRNPPGAPPVTTTTYTHTTYNLSSINDGTGVPRAFYLVGGFEGRISYFSIRPEFRYSHFPNPTIPTYTKTNQNQVEFLIAISVHPFPRQEIRVK